MGSIEYLCYFCVSVILRCMGSVNCIHYFALVLCYTVWVLTLFLSLTPSLFLSLSLFLSHTHSPSLSLPSLPPSLSPPPPPFSLSLSLLSLSLSLSLSLPLSPQCHPVGVNDGVRSDAVRSDAVRSDAVMGGEVRIKVVTTNSVKEVPTTKATPTQPQYSLVAIANDSDWYVL